MDSYQRNSSWLLRSTRGLLYFCARIRTESSYFCVYVPMHCIHASQNIQLRLTALLFSCYSNLNCLNNNETDKPWSFFLSHGLILWELSDITCMVLHIVYYIYCSLFVYILHFLLNCQQQASCLLGREQNKTLCVCACMCVCLCACAHTSETDVPCNASFCDVFLLTKFLFFFYMSDVISH